MTFHTVCAIQAEIKFYAAIGRQLYCFFQFSYFQYFELKYFFISEINPGDTALV